MREARRGLAETLSHIDSLLGDGRSREDVLDVGRLSLDSGVPREVVEALLEGGEAPAEDITDRIVRRFGHLRETRLRPDGSRHSYEEIAAAFGASRASLSNLLNSRRRTAGRGAEQRPGRSGGPLASTQAGIETFYFGQPNGWLSAEPETALDDALQPVLRGLEEQAADPMARLRHAHGLRRLAARAPQLAEEEIQLVTDWIDTILERRRAQDARGAQGAQGAQGAEGEQGARGQGVRRPGGQRAQDQGAPTPGADAPPRDVR
ncbi:hypothetical protein [Streptomyces sp. NPDC056785]|uniref:hypothetical protein n=1 Tax=unclassified Streptomyces TaxID=2593676 RepID=UPI0036BC4F0C